MMYEGKKLEEQAVMQIASLMCVAARTAPKAHGKDTVHTLVLTGAEKDLFADKMETVGEELMGAKSENWFKRDAQNVRRAQALVLIGAENTYRGVSPCGMCGFKDCEGCKKAAGKCAFALLDLGIAISSAVKTAQSNNADNRIMYSVGRTAETMGYSLSCSWLGVPLSTSGKNIFFDRGIFHD